MRPNTRRMPTARAVLAAACAVLLSIGACAGTPASPPGPASARAALPAAITVDALRGHLRALEDLADRNGGNRFTCSPGFEAAADYVEKVLAGAGYRVTRERYETAVPVEDGPPVVEIAGPAGGRFDDGEEARTMLYSAAGDVSAPVARLGAGGSARAAGCSVSDFAGFPTGAIALLDPGPCRRLDQVTAAQSAGAAAVVVVYPWGPGEMRRPTLIYPGRVRIPAVVAARDLGRALDSAAARGATVHLRTSSRLEPCTAENIIAEQPGADPGMVVMVGAHLDSPGEGAGMNDNGSGVAAVLEIARALAAAPLDRQVRYVFWSGEELGLHGSVNHVRRLSPDALRSIAAYVNLDMVGSRFGRPFVYTDSDAPEGSEVIRDALADALERRGRHAEPEDMRGGSDHAPFAEAGVPVGGIYTGSSDAPLAAGGPAASPTVYDPCYHLACDRVDNVNLALLHAVASAAAEAVAVLAGN